MDERKTLLILLVLATILLAGCLHNVENEVCKNVKSMGLDASTSCDRCYQILERSGQQEWCLEKKELNVLGNPKTLYVHLDNGYSKWGDCYKLSEDEGLKCACCVMRGWGWDDGKCYSNDAIAALQKTRNLYDLATKKELTEQSVHMYFSSGRCRR